MVKQVIHELASNHVSIAGFLDSKSAHELDLLLPVFDPVIVKMTSVQLLHRGYQIRCIESQDVHTAQCWGTRLVDSVDPIAINSTDGFNRSMQHVPFNRFEEEDHVCNAWTEWMIGARPSYGANEKGEVP